MQGLATSAREPLMAGQRADQFFGGGQSSGEFIKKSVAKKLALDKYVYDYIYIHAPQTSTPPTRLIPEFLELEP